MLTTRSRPGRLVLGLVLLVAASSCLANGSRESAGAILRIGFGTGPSARVMTLGYLTDQLFAETLLVRGWDGRQSPGLVTRWAWSEAGRTLTLDLKEGVLFHDGTPLSAEMVRNILQPREPAEWGFEHVTSVEVAGERRLTIRLSRPDLFLLNGLADRRIVHPASPGVGTGPFTLLRKAPIVEAARFDRYHGGASPLAGVTIVPYDRSRSVWSALMRGEVDAAHEVNLDSIEFMERSSKIRTYATVQPFYVAMVFNLRNPFLKNLEVRRAIGEALDRETILARAMRGRGRLADGPIWPDHWAYSPTGSPLRYSPSSARSRLEAAGYRMRAADGNGTATSRLKLKCLVFDEEPQYEHVALMMQRQLLEVGIELEIELVGLQSLAERALRGDFDTYVMRMNAGRSMDFTYRAWRSRLPDHLRMQDSGYTGADDALDQLRSSLAEDEVVSAVRQLSERFQHDVPAVFISWLEVTRAVSSGFDVGGGGPDPLFNLRQWRPAAQTAR